MRIVLDAKIGRDFLLCGAVVECRCRDAAFQGKTRDGHDDFLLNPDHAATGASRLVHDLAGGNTAHEQVNDGLLGRQRGLVGLHGEPEEQREVPLHEGVAVRDVDGLIGLAITVQGHGHQLGVEREGAVDRYKGRRGHEDQQRRE